MEKAAGKRMKILMENLFGKYSVPDKEKDARAWVTHMNSLKAMAEEVILEE